MKGIDISNHNGSIDFNKVKDSGVELVYVKATEGTTYQDPYRDINYNGATIAGLPVGFYHFLVGSSLPETQAENFYNSISNKNNSLKPSLDIEVSGFDVMGFALRFISKFNSLSNLPLVIYSSPHFINNNLDGRLSSYPLWVAHYGVSTPISNNVWGASYVGHQYTDTGSVNGIVGKVDLNNFYDGIFVSSRGESNVEVSQETVETLLEKAKNYIGSRVKELQEKLIAKGYDCGVYGDDGIFGPATQNVVKSFQKRKGLSVDGIVGFNTWGSLLR